MTPLAMIRHGPTEWNAARRIQGHCDVPLSEAGHRQVERWRIPNELQGLDWVVSPLLRTRQTAALLGVKDPILEPLLVEMHWGEWEGKHLDALRQSLGQEMAANEARGLNFQPPGGESPRQVQQRLMPWLARIAQRERATAVITHKGVIRAAFALATGWDMISKPPVRLHWDCAHLFLVDEQGLPHPARFNIPLSPHESS